MPQLILIPFSIIVSSILQHHPYIHLFILDCVLQVPNDAILKCDNFTDMSGKEMMDPTQDKTINIKAK